VFFNVVKSDAFTTLKLVTPVVSASPALSVPSSFCVFRAPVRVTVSHELVPLERFL